MKLKTLYRMPSILALLLVLSPITPVYDAVAQDARKPSVQNLPDFADMAEKLAPIVVNISTTQVSPGQSSPGQPGQPGPGPMPPPGESDPFNEFWRRFFGQPFGGPQGSVPQRGLGSGIIIDAKGLVLTNNHVVENAQKITIRLNDERQFDAKVVGKDSRTDLAVVQLNNVTGNLPVATLGDSDRLRVGEWVLAMGSPFGLDNSITSGIVSAKGRNIGAGPYDNFIQTDASINPGNSGGPLLSLRGEVVGINTAIFSRTGGNIGIGFAIPINLAKQILPELISKGKVTRGWLGVSIQQITPAIGESLGMDNSRGALVASVIEDSPAAQAGIKIGDVIIDYNGNEIKDASELPILVAQTKVGETAKVRVLRDKKPVSLTVKIAELEQEEEVVASAGDKGQLGLALQNVTPEIAESLGLDQATGVVVTAVQPQSAAAEAGIRRGDVILEVNQKKVRNMTDIRKITEQAKPGANLLFLLRRGESNIFAALRTPDGRG